jgi:hypothetical protein
VFSTEKSCLFIHGGEIVTPTRGEDAHYGRVKLGDSLRDRIGRIWILCKTQLISLIHDSVGYSLVVGATAFPVNKKLFSVEKTHLVLYS